MAEESRPWPGTTVGDAGPYSDDDWDDIWEILYGSGLAPYNDRGVIRNWTNELEVTDGGANTADIDTGAALVHGKFYNHTAPVINLNIPNSVGAWREDLVCLQSDWTAQTVRIARHPNPADGVAYPAPTQNDGVTWEIPLAAVRINNAGVITLITDLRDYVSDLMQPKEISKEPTSMLPGGAAWVAVTGEHTAVERTVAGDWCLFEIALPHDFISCIEAYVVISASVNNVIDWTFNTDGGGCGEAVNAWTDTATDDNQAVTQDDFVCIDVTAAFQNATIEAGDIVGCMLVLDVISAGFARAFMLVVRYR